MFRLFSRLVGMGRPAEPRIADELWARSLSQHPICVGLSADKRARLRERTEELLRAVYVDAVAGVEVDEGLRLSVALQAALPVLELGVGWYRSVRSILLVPTEYETEHTLVDEAGVVHEHADVISGEVGDQMPVVLSIADVEASGWGDGYNVVIHEMVHVLDASNGELDGIPALPRRQSAATWRASFEAAFADHRRRVDRADRLEHAERRAGSRRPVKPPVVDSYGAEAPEEFFACSAELFFERPRRLHRAYPDLFAEYRAFFGFDPRGEAARLRDDPEGPGG